IRAALPLPRLLLEDSQAVMVGPREQPMVCVVLAIPVRDGRALLLPGVRGVPEQRRPTSYRLLGRPRGRFDSQGSVALARAGILPCGTCPAHLLDWVNRLDGRTEQEELLPLDRHHRRRVIRNLSAGGEHGRAGLATAPVEVVVVGRFRHRAERRRHLDLLEATETVPPTIVLVPDRRTVAVGGGGCGLRAILVFTGDGFDDPYMSWHASQGIGPRDVDGVATGCLVPD